MTAVTSRRVRATTESFSTLDNVGSLGAFVLELALVAAAIVTVTRERSTSDTT